MKHSSTTNAPAVFLESLKKNMSMEDIVTLESCLGCRNCGTACAWFLATDDETLHPLYRKDFIKKIYKRHLTTEGKVLNFFKSSYEISEEELLEYMDGFWKCTACGRCSLPCPIALNSRGIFRLARVAYCDAGLTIKNPTRKSIIENTRDTSHSFGLTREQVFIRLGIFLSYEGIDIPIDVKGAKYLFVCPGVGNTKLPDYGVAIPKIFNTGQVNYTVSSRVVDTGTEIDHVAVHQELSARMLMQWEDEGERLEVDQVLVTECGCDVATMYIEAEKILGRPFKFPIASIDTIFIDLIKSGKIPVKKIDQKVTLHDSCYVTRLSGLGDMTRELLELVAENFVEMTPNREQNYCCNGGAGPMRHPEFTELRRKVSKIKAEQIKMTEAEIVVSPCAVCMITVNDICKFYELEPKGKRMSMGLYEIVYMAMFKALEERGETERMKLPFQFKGQKKKFISRHGITNIMDNIFDSLNINSYLEWLSDDEIMARYINDHPESKEHMETLLRKRII